MPVPEYIRNLRARIGHESIVMAGVMAVILDDNGAILCERRSDNGQWCLPGGILDPGEEPGAGVIREVFEETGLEVHPERLIGVYHGPDCVTYYPNGDVVVFLDFIVACRAIGGKLAVNDDESLEVRYFPHAGLPAIPPKEREYADQALKYDPRTHFRTGAEKGKPLMSISNYISSLRAKIGHDLLLMPGVAAVVINAAGEVLLQRRSDNGEWGLPGGAVDPGEEPADAVIREVHEETGLEVIPERLVGVYSGPDFLMRYPNGDEAMIMSLTFACRPVGGEPCVNDDESLEVRYFPPDALPPLNDRNRLRIQQTLRNDPRTHFRIGSIQEKNSQ